MKTISTLKKSRFYQRGIAIAAMAAFMTLTSCREENVIRIDGEDFATLNTDMRKLWSEHMEWTYATVDAFFHDANGLGAKLNRLLLNQQHIGQAITPYFGQEAGDKLAGLLTEHIEDAVPVLTAAQEGDNEALEAALDEWYRNAQEVGDHFAAINPEYWEQAELRDVWKTHITQTVTYSVDLLQNDLDKAIADYQEAYNHMMGMGDLMTTGIARKFPNKFQ